MLKKNKKLKKTVRNKETRTQVTAFSHVTLRMDSEAIAYPQPPRPLHRPVSHWLCWKRELHKLAFLKQEISLAFISILTLNTHPDSVLISFGGDVGFLGSSPGSLEVGRGKLQTQIQNLGKDAVRPVRTRWQVLVA